MKKNDKQIIKNLKKEDFLHLSKSLKEVQDYLNNVLESIYSGIITFDLMGKIKTINPPTERILKINKEEALNKHYRSILPEELSLALGKWMPVVLKTNKICEFEQEIKTIYGTNILIGCGLAKLKSRDDKTLGMVMIFQDITYRRKITVLEELNKIKSEFVSTVAHELRTPLTSIQGYSEIIADYKCSLEDVKKFAKIINQESERLARLIDNYLNLSRIELGKFRLKKEVFDINDVICDRIILYQAETNKHKITSFIQKEILPIYADKDKIIQVLNNLLLNAIKYSPDGGEINISAKTTDKNNFLEVCISDEGLGISKDALPFIFERFERGDITKDIVKGTGLGLAISKHIINSHKGKIWVESQSNLGSKFYFKIPIEKPMIKKILVVDDNKELVDSVSRSLEIEGFQTALAYSGIDCMKKLKEESIYLLILDIKLPDKDGYQILEEMRKDEKLKGLPVILISGVEEPDIKKLEELGVKEFLTKPFSHTILNGIVEKILKE